MNWIGRYTDPCGNGILDDDRRLRKVRKVEHSVGEVGGSRGVMGNQVFMEPP